MVGLPGDNEARSLISAEKTAALQPDFVRIYPTVVLKGSKLAHRYRDGSFTPLSLEEAVTLVKKLYLVFKKHDIRVIRMGLQASEDLEDDTILLAGPYHPAFGHMVYSEVFFDKAAAAIESAAGISDRLTILVNPRSISHIRGLNNSNIERLKSCYKLKSVAVVSDRFLETEELKVQ
jgi:coproporphyrinogen III oxidase-like Fe-S oxidoreductase